MTGPSTPKGDNNDEEYHGGVHPSVFSERESLKQVVVEKNKDKRAMIRKEKEVLKSKLKIPPAIHQFSMVADVNLAKNLFSFLNKYQPEKRSDKRRRLMEEAKNIVDKKPAKASEERYEVQFGLNKVTSLIESKRAMLVVIANDIDNIELVIFLPALCRKMGVPYVIVKNQERLGRVVRKGHTTTLAVTCVRPADKVEFSSLIETVKAKYNDRFNDIRKQWGGSASKSQRETGMVFEVKGSSSSKVKEDKSSIESRTRRKRTNKRNRMLERCKAAKSAIEEKSE